MEENKNTVQKVPIRRKRTIKKNFSSKKPTSNQDVVKIIPLGGLGEVGRNMHVIQYKNEAIVLDIGLRFPEYTMHGIDFIIPNIEYFKEHPEVKVLGVFISHGHYDHIGAIPYIIDKLNYPPIYAAPMSRGIIIKRQDEFGHLRKLNIHVIDKNKLEPINLGPFTIEPFHVNHNIPDSLGAYITTPNGKILFTGDFKLDFHPVADKPTNLSKIVSLANKGVDLLMIDSTGVENPGHSMSEKEIYSNLEKLFEEIEGRIILSTFASLIGRIQQAIWLAEKYHRKVALSGYTMKANFLIAKKIGHIKCKANTMIDIREANKYKPNQILIICTGAQGEENATLNRIVSKTDRNIRLTPQDSVIFSSSVVPGNEMAVQNLKDNISKQGAKLYHYKMLDIHASGHANREDLKLFLNIVNPKNVMPIHGYFYMQKTFGDLIKDTLPLNDNNCIIVSNGQVIEMRGNNVQATQKFVPASYVMVDGLGVGDIGEVIMKDRAMLADDGIFICNVLMNKNTNKIKLIEVVSRGFIVMKESRDLIEEAKKEINKAVEQELNKGLKPTDSEFKKDIRDKISSYLVRKTERKPMVVALITLI